MASKNRKIYINSLSLAIKKSHKKYYACIVFQKKNTYLRVVILKE
ncbi:hypothetical protein SAMN04488513_108125 [Pseudozobellia thermophila]|uniref:Uncharacterized protein n=1 Tax=Pseudozobellia thermophila TaxID=192903 RepID=A0A1M6M0Y9_9FLAO|nr:hypothetical protein SAMN04488513_108125 [Pseudozobellia thermophila]